MRPKTSAEVQADLFNLKNVSVELVPVARRSARAFLTVGDLEVTRTQRPAVAASKHGLETICGASCEIGAH